MPRKRRITPAGTVFHVLNRGAARQTLFFNDADYEAFERMLADAARATNIRLCAFCLMPNHWHLVVWPTIDGQISAFVQRLARRHAVRWQLHYGAAGTGHLYQGRFKSFAVQTDASFWRLVRYVERNALRANLVERAEQWRWSSLWWRINHPHQASHFLSEWPMPATDAWIDWVNEPQTETELGAIRHCVAQGLPFGETSWAERIKESCDLAPRPRGRPKKRQLSQVQATESSPVVDLPQRIAKVACE